MGPGQELTVTITMKNVGTTTWDPAAKYFLGSQNPENNWTWGLARVPLDHPVAQGEQKTFTFTITAPTTPGDYPFQWRLVQENVEWFGDFTEDIEVNVGGIGRKFDDMILVAKNGKFVRKDRIPIDFRGAISCCGGGYGWPLFNDEWANYVKEQGNVNFLHARLGPFRKISESEWADTGGGYLEVDGKTDLTQWNDGFWQRVRHLIEYAGNLGMWVEIDVCDAWRWRQGAATNDASPWRPEHNLQGQDWNARAGRQAISGGNVHEQWVRKVVQETGRYGNVIYQDGNEVAVRGGYVPAWTLSMSNIIHDEEERNGYLRHLVGTNSGNVDTMEAVQIDYIEFHSDDAPDLTFGKPTGSNEYNPDPPFEPEDLYRRYCDGRGKGTYFWYWRHGQTKPKMDRTLEMVKGGCGNLGNGAQFVSQAGIPSTMQPGQRATVSITMKNTGTTTWTRDAGYKLGSQNPENNTVWGINRVELGQERVVTGQTIVLNITLTAPSTPGVYNFQWQMLRENVEWFGDATPNVEITVGGSALVNDARFITQSVPTVILPGQTATASIILDNTGTSTWDPAANFFLGSQNPENNWTWGLARVALDHPVAPGEQKTFTFTITAPPAPGDYPFQWQMVQEHVEWFGDLTPATRIQVASTGNGCARMGRSGLSGMAAAVLSSIEANPRAIAESPVPLPRILSTCNRFVSLAIDGPRIFAAGRDIIVLAEHEVDMAFFEWEEGSHAASLIGDGLIAAQARRTPSDPLLVRIVIDDIENPLTDRAVNHLWNSQKQWVSRGLDTARVQLQFGTSPRPTPAAANLHDKFIIVDARYLLVTGANVQSFHDPGAPWHDSGYVLEGDVAQSALASFEHTWTGDAFHWECKQEGLSKDCDKRAHYPQPARSWLPPFGSQWPGNLPILAVGRPKGSTFPTPDNDTNNPQDIAWLTLMNRATSHIHIESPNINDDAFRAAVVRAVGRGVAVRLLTSLGFNDLEQDLPGLGGDNLEVVGNLRKEIRAAFPGNQECFQLRWYSKDRIEPIAGKGDWASHTKYMSIDDRLAVVGSGNMDTIAWNFSHEFNLLIDDAPTVAELEASLFLRDWNRAIGSYVELYEGNNATQDLLCMIAVNQDKSLRFGDPIDGSDWKCNNDEARSALLHDVPAGKVLRFYDDPFRSESDDWIEVIVKRAVARKYLGSFERSFEDDEVRVIYHRYDGLDGKISAADVATTSMSPVPSQP
jgi:phosphatidylserine/phosphatidylglycerophosphate/cardiolipin synthase-like enzyme